MATIIDKMVKSGLSAFDTIKKGGTPTQAVTQASRTYQSKPGESPSSYTPSTPTVTNNKRTRPVSASISPSLMDKATNLANGVTNSMLNVAGVPNAVSKVVNSANNAANTANNVVNSGGNKQQAVQAAQGVLSNPLQTPQQQAQQVPVVDPNLAATLQEIMKMLQAQTQPKAVPQYQSQYNDEIAGLINQFNSRPAFSFDATNNPTIEANKKLISDSVMQEMGRRNMLNSTITGDRMTKDIATMVNTVLPQLQQQAYNQYQDEGQNTLQQLQNYLNLDQNDRNIFMDNYNMGQDASQNQFANTMSIANLIDNLDTKNFNKTQTEKEMAMKESDLTGVYNPNAQYALTPDIINQISQFSGNYQAEIDRRKATPDTTDDALIPYMENARYQKIQGMDDSATKDQYLDKYKTPSQKAAEANAELERQKLALEADPNSLENQIKIAEITKKQVEIDQLLKYGGAEAEAKIDQIRASANASKASASASYASANANNALATQRLNSNENSSSEEKFTTADKNIFYLDALESIKNNPNNAVEDVVALRDYLLKTVKMSLTEYNSLLETAKKIQAINSQTDSLSAVNNPLGSVLKGQISQALGR